MLKNRLALVTGGASGIGKCIAELFAKNGAHVAVADISPALTNVASEIANNSGQKVTSHECDVSSSSSVNNLFKEIESQYPKHKCPTIIVNNAGIIRLGWMVKTNEERFDQVIGINLKGTFLVTQAASKGLMANFSNFDSSDPLKTYGSIINISSIAGEFGAKTVADYSASKAGVDGFTKATSKELGKFKIRCNSIQPGFIKTPMMDDNANDGQLELLKRFITLRRLGEPEDIAQLALFLASDNSSYITGGTFECNGGMVI